MKIKGLVNCAIILLVVAVFVIYAGHVLRPVDTDSAVAAINAFHALPENSLEVIGFGSSHMWRGLDPSVMYDEYGISAYNYGCNWQKCNTTSLFIQDALRTQKPKVILVETFLLGEMMMNDDMNGEIYYTRAIDEFSGKLRFLKQCFVYDWERYLSYYVPFCAFHDNWTEISKQSFKLTMDGSGFLQTKGFVGTDDVTQISILDHKSMPQSEFQDAARREIEYIIQVCRENNVEIVFYVHPYEGEYIYFDAMNALASEYGYPFLNLFELNDEIGLDGATDFSDIGHLNTSGSQKVARYLSEYLKANYDLTDARVEASA